MTSMDATNFYAIGKWTCIKAILYLGTKSIYKIDAVATVVSRLVHQLMSSACGRKTSQLARLAGEKHFIGLLTRNGIYFKDRATQ